MALDNFANLKASIISFSGRDDLSANIDDFIALAEAAFYSNSQPLRLRSFEASTTLVTVGGTNSVALPAGFLEARSVQIEANGTIYELIFNSPSALAPVFTSGTPYYYSITSTLIFDKTPDAAYNLPMAYYGKPTPLSSTDPVNVVLTDYPNIYLYGALSALYDFTDDLQNAEAFHGKMMRGIAGANKADKKARVGPNARIRVQGSTP